MTDPLAAKKLLREFGLQPRKDLGQNFIIHRRSLEKIIHSADLSQDQFVLEVGAGLGALTRELAASVSQVVAVELDRRLLPILEAVLDGLQNVRLVVGDVLKLQIEVPSEYQIVANIPYSVTSALIRHFLEAERPPRSMVLTVQSEVAERATAEPGKMSLLALSVQVYGSPEIRGRIPARSFYPEPEVDSAILRIDMHSAPLVDANQIATMFRLARSAFSQRRKKLRNSLAPVLGKSASPVLEAAGIDPSARAQELGVQDWKALAGSAEQFLGDEDGN